MADYLKYTAVLAGIYLSVSVALAAKGWLTTGWMAIPIWILAMWITHGTDLDMRVQRWFDTIRKRPAEAG